MASPSSAACPPAMFAISRPTRTVAPAPLARASAAPRFALGGPRAVAKPTGAERFLRARGGQASTSGRSHHVAASAGPASPCLRRRATRCHVRTRGASGDCDARPSSRAERAAESAPEEDGTSLPSSPFPNSSPSPPPAPRFASDRPWWPWVCFEAPSTSPTRTGPALSARRSSARSCTTPSRCGLFSSRAPSSPRDSKPASLPSWAPATTPPSPAPWSRACGAPPRPTSSSSASPRSSPRCTPRESASNPAPRRTRMAPRTSSRSSSAQPA